MQESPDAFSGFLPIVLPRGSNAALACGALIGVSLAGVATAIATDPGVTTAGAIAISAVGGLLAAALITLSFAFGAERGGLFHDQINDRFGVGLTSARDRWWIPGEDVRGVRCARTSYVRGTETISSWSVNLERQVGLPISLHETWDRGEAQEIVKRIAANSALERLDDFDEVKTSDDAPDEETPRPTQVNEATETFQVGGRWALKWALLLFGLSLLTVGLTLLLVARENLVFSLFFAPVLALFGGILVGIVAFKRYGRETLVRHAGGWTFYYRMAGVTWGMKTVTGSAPTWRIKLHPLRGGCLELIGNDGILVMGAGATTRSDLTIAALSRLRETFATPPSTTPSPAPHPEA